MAEAAPAVSVVVPCYCSGSWLAEFVERTCAALAGESFEIILVNDGSNDGTWEVISRIAGQRPEVRGIDLLFNTGQHRATMCGLQAARGDIVATIDDDLQQPPESLPAMITRLREPPQMDCVIGAYESKRHGLFRNLGTAVMGKLFQWLYGKPPKLQMTSFRVMTRALVDAVSLYATVNPNLNPLIFQTTSRIVNAPVPHHPRHAGRSGYGFLQLLRLMLDNVLSVSTFPLKVVSFLGFSAAVGSGLLGSYYLMRALGGQFQVEGFATQVLLIIFFGGLTLFSVGLLGEYVIRIMEEVRGRPRYIVRELVGDGGVPGSEADPSAPPGGESDQPHDELG